jgi:hypothetical protein
VHAYVAQWSTSQLKSAQMTFSISMLKNIFPLHTETQDLSSISIPMCNSNCDNVVFFSLKRGYLCGRIEIILAISGRGTKYHKRCTSSRCLLSLRFRRTCHFVWGLLVVICIGWSLDLSFCGLLQCRAGIKIGSKPLSVTRAVL